MKNTNKASKALGVLSSTCIATALGIAAISSFSAVADKSDKELQIVGGKESTPYSRPYQVALLMNGRQGCGGTLISKDWVLTAAHCLGGASTSNLTVRVGAHSISANDGTTHRVSQIISHEYWGGSVQSGYDIAVLRLATSASSSITPASLPTRTIADQLAGVGSYVTVSGWGLTYNNGSPSDRLREVDLPVLSNSSCSSQLGSNIGSGVICGGGTGSSGSQVSACNGDSGGPYAVQGNGKYYSIGTVSWGRDCRGATAFTRTTSYLDWIEQKTGLKPDDGEGENPVASFTESVNDLTVSFNNTSTDDEGIASSSWRMGDGTTLNSTSPTHTYSSDGTYTVVLTVTDTDGNTDSASKSITVGSQCEASTSSSPAAPAWDQYRSYAIGDRVSYNGVNYVATWWSTGARPDIYTNVWQKDSGTTDPCGEGPTADFSVSTNQLTASFTDASSDDQGVVSRSWNFGDGSTSTAANPSHTYSSAGSYTVTLTVHDADGNSDSASRVVQVSGTTDGCDGYAAWSAGTSYGIGDVVSYNGYKYESTWWSTGARPDIYSNVWRFVGTCSN